MPRSGPHVYGNFCRVFFIFCFYLYLICLAYIFLSSFIFLRLILYFPLPHVYGNFNEVFKFCFYLYFICLADIFLSSLSFSGLFTLPSFISPPLSRLTFFHAAAVWWIYERRGTNNIVHVYYPSVQEIPPRHYWGSSSAFTALMQARLSLCSCFYNLAVA